MAPPRKPLAKKPGRAGGRPSKAGRRKSFRTDDAYLCECFCIDDDDNTLVRRSRPIEHFAHFNDPADARLEYNTRFAGRPAGSTDERGRMRVKIDGRLVDARKVFAALGSIDGGIRRTVPNGVGDIGIGPLASIIATASRETGLSLKHLTVLDVANDPYRFDTPTKRRDGAWFAEHWAARHIRGFHYKLIGQATKPDGSPYTGAFANYQWLQEAANAARWLGLIPFDNFDDRRNGEPVIYRAERDHTKLSATVTTRIDAEPPSIEVLDGDDDGELYFRPALDGMAAEQPFIIAIFGEKSSLRDELLPIAVEMEADLYLETGEQSITHAYHIAKRAAADGRHLVVGVVTDCDMSGWQMAISIARKLQALRDLLFPSLKVDVIHIGLTPDQVRHYGLPESPLSDNDKRKARWKERMGVEQTEIDALLELHPGAVGQMVRGAFAPYFDPTLAARVREAESAWLAEAEDAIEEALDEAERAWQAEDDSDGEADDNSLPGLKARAEAVSARIKELNDDVERAKEAAAHIDAEGDDIRAEVEAIMAAMADIADGIDLDLPDVPKAGLPDRPTNGPNMVLSSAWSWVEATQRLKARKAYENDDDDEEDDAP